MAQVTDNKENIIFLITQEIKHTKFLQSLSNIGLEPEDHYITVLDGILPLIYAEVGKPMAEMTDELVDIYYGAIDRVKDYPNLELSREFRPLAESCYQLVVAYIESKSKERTIALL